MLPGSRGIPVPGDPGPPALAGAGTGPSYRAVRTPRTDPGAPRSRRGPNEGPTARPTALRPPPLTGLSVLTGQDQATRTPGSHSGSAQKAKKPGLGAGPGHPEPRRKGEMTLGPSMKIMPLDPYSTLGRSCEPAYQVDSAAGPRWRPSGELLACLAGKLTRGPARSVPGLIGDWQPRTPGAPRSAELGYSPAGFGQLDLLKPT